tara:strand:- start:1095 stop:2357 length:1263 start_codon:yes stop_codon:yes gene_type:complete
MRKAKNILSNIDTTSIFIYLTLILIGFFNIYASQYNDDISMTIDLSTRYGKQFYFTIFAIFTALIILIIDWKFFYSLSYIFHITILILLIGVLIFGGFSGGAKSWYEIGQFKLQPSEFAKFSTALALAKFLNDIKNKKNNYIDNVKTYLIFILPAILIILQNDLGTSLVYSGFILVLYREGMSGNILIIGVVMLVLFILTLIISKPILIFIFSFIALINIYKFRKKTKGMFIITFVLLAITTFIFSVDYIFSNILAQHQQKRINILVGKEIDPHGAGYNLIQSKIAIGSGGILGKGFLKGTQTRFDFVPEQSTDFIFCTIGEEWGFLGSLVFILLYIGLLLRLAFLAERQRSNFSRIYGYSVVIILFLHFVINIGMTIGLLPIIGIPLPFISYGGSSLLGFTVLLFIFLNLDSYRLQILR